MIRSLVITVPASQRAAVNAALDAAGYGSDCVSLPMRNGEAVGEDPTHYSSHWYGRPETIDAILSIPEVAAATRHEGGPTDPQGIFAATNGDYVRLAHKQFDNGQWGWRAEFVAQAGEFQPGVRAIAIYADAEHQEYSYTTGAFTDDNGTWVTEWNDGRGNPADVHWALIYASQPEHAGTLGADETEDIGWLRVGVPGDAVPPEAGTPEWETGVSYSVGDLVLYQGTEYECLQAHTSQAGWNPVAVPALWSAV